MKLNMGDAAIIAALADAALCVVYAVMVEVRERRRKKAIRRALDYAMRVANDETDDNRVAYAWGVVTGISMAEDIIFDGREVVPNPADKGSEQ